MRKVVFLSYLMIKLFTVEAQQEKFSNYPVYPGNDLGLVYSPVASVFRLWAPAAEEVQLLFYNEGIGGQAFRTESMQHDKNGAWIISIDGNWKGKFYAFRAKIHDEWLHEVPDPYAKCVGVNGKRAMVIDLHDTNPAGWEKDKSPSMISRNDAIIYELHIRDASIAANSGIIHKGKFTGLAEKGTVNNEGLSTGLDHLKELGVTHIHLLPFFDYATIDETKLDSNQYNWGYDPLNYNVPEGSYSTDPYNGMTRIKELKQMIKTFHENGLRIIMDVAYNHTSNAGSSCFNQLVPGYYYRQNADGKLSNGTGCGNETASERAMMRKFMLESVMYWVKEYHIDGFRFDLMGVHDTTTMNLISKELYRVRPDILIYGEGWTAGTSPLPESMRSVKANVSHLDKIAVFSDDIRDAIKGNVFNEKDKGFVSGGSGEESIKFGVVASCLHSQIDYSKVNYSKAPYAAAPWQTITYCECHDNHVLWDKLLLAAPEASDEERKEMYKLSLSIVLTSQGISFLHAGSEFIRTKKGVENSYESPDSINEIDWHLKTVNEDVFDYVKALIRIRKEHPSFRMRTTEQMERNIHFDENLPAGIVAYTIDGAAMKDSWRKIKVFYNGSNIDRSFALDSKNWLTGIINNKIGSGGNVGSTVRLRAHSCTVLYLQIP